MSIPINTYDTPSDLDQIAKLSLITSHPSSPQTSSQPQTSALPSHSAAPTTTSVRVAKRTAVENKLKRLSLRWWGAKRKTLRPALVLTVAVLPAVSLYLVVTRLAPSLAVLVAALVYLLICSMAHNAGFHRLGAHRAFRTSAWMMELFALIGAGAGLGSMRWWVTMHRAHHRFCGEPMRDPCCTKRGMAWAHTGWMLNHPHPKLAAVLPDDHEDHDGETEMVMAWLERHYALQFFFSALFLPAMVGYLLGDVLDGVVYVGLVRMAVLQQVVGLQNSLCHSSWGHRNYEDTDTLSDLALWNLFTFGEGRHNFHHAFPRDYRCGNLYWYDWDPTKWTIQVMSRVGLAWEVHTSPHLVVEQLRIQQLQKRLDSTRASLDWGVPLDKLPVISAATFSRLAAQTKGERVLVVISGVVHDVTPFVDDHPGGVALVASSNGKDATLAFTGAVYMHSNAAKNLLATMRVAVLGSHQQEVWRQHVLENKNVPVKNDSAGRRIVRLGEQATMGTVVHASAEAA